MSETSPQRGGRDAVALLRSSVARTRVWVFCSMQHVVNDSIEVERGFRGAPLRGLKKRRFHGRRRSQQHNPAIYQMCSGIS